jgi:hypothetical protein
MKARILLACAFVAATAIVAVSTGAAFAAATGNEIRSAIAGNTVQGNMSAGGAYLEFYDPSGAIKGKDYVGQWSVEGDLMCFSYQATPKECWNVEINGDQVRWIRNGAAQGTGTILHGNPNGLGKVP